MKPRSTRLAFALVALGSLASCGDADTGSAPVITGLTLDPRTVTHGTVNLQANFTVTDADLDATSFQLRVVSPGGISNTSAATGVSGLQGRTGVLVQTRVTLVLPEAGRYTVEFWVNDLQGHASNRLSGVIDAT